MKRIKATTNHAPETDYAIHLLAKLWRVPLAQAWARCVHFTAYEDRGVGANAAPRVKQKAELRQAEARVEMLKDRSNSA